MRFSSSVWNFVMTSLIPSEIQVKVFASLTEDRRFFGSRPESEKKEKDFTLSVEPGCNEKKIWYCYK